MFPQDLKWHGDHRAELQLTHELEVPLTRGDSPHPGIVDFRDELRLASAQYLADGVIDGASYWDKFMEQLKDFVVDGAGVRLAYPPNGSISSNNVKEAKVGEEGNGLNGQTLQSGLGVTGNELPTALQQKTLRSLGLTVQSCRRSCGQLCHTIRARVRALRVRLTRVRQSQLLFEGEN